LEESDGIGHGRRKNKEEVGGTASLFLVSQSYMFPIVIDCPVK